MKLTLQYLNLQGDISTHTYIYIYDALLIKLALLIVTSILVNILYCILPRVTHAIVQLNF